MTAERRLRAARALCLASGAVVLLCVGLLAGDYVLAVSVEAEELRRVETLEAGAKQDAAVAARLHEERDRRTAASIARKTRARFAAWTLLVAGAGLVAAGKWAVALRPQPQPALATLVAERFAVPPPTHAPPPGRGGDRAGGEPGVDLSVVDRLVARHGAGRDAAIPILQGIQDHFRYLPDEALTRVCETTEITPAQIAGTSSFYAQFRRSPVGRHVVRVCHGTACHVAGASQITQELRRHLAMPPDADTDEARRFTLDAVACLGCCSLAPVMMIEDQTLGRLSPARARQALDAVEPTA